MQNQLVGKLARARRLIGQLRNRRLAVWSDSTEQRRESLAEAKTDCSWVKQSATPSVRKLTAGTIRNSETWWIKTLELTNRFVSLLETVTDRFDQGLEDAETLAAVKQLDKVDAALRLRADRLAAVLDLPGLGKGTPPAKLERPDVSAIKSDLQQIVEAFRVLREGMLLDYRRHWRDAGAILHRLNVRLGDPKHNSLWRGGLDVTDADSRWLDAVGEFVESANKSFENLDEPDNATARYMSGVLQRDAEHALESFSESREASKPVEPRASRPDSLGMPQTKSAKPRQRKPRVTLNDLQQGFLDAMDRLKGGSQSEPLSTSEIGGEMNPPKKRTELRTTREKLRDWKMIGTASHDRNGGCWLLRDGRRRVSKAKDRKKPPKPPSVS